MEFQLNHDLHLHTHLSLCSNDPEQNIANIVAFATKHGYSDLCITDHFWDDAVPGPSDWYARQNYAHITEDLPYPNNIGKLRLMFGCETEYCGGKKLGISRECADKLDFIVIPPNHFHMEGFTRDAGITDMKDVADLFGRRMTELTKLDMPWRKVGIAHITCGLAYAKGDCYEMFKLVDKGRFKDAFAFLAENGAGIELNDDCFEKPVALEEENLAIYFMAKEAGCKFYRASDAHHPDRLAVTPGVTEAVRLLGLTDEDRYTVPENK